MENKRIRPDRRKPMASEAIPGEKSDPSAVKKSKKPTRKSDREPAESSSPKEESKPAQTSLPHTESKTIDGTDPQVSVASESVILSGAAEISVPLSAEHIRAFAQYSHMLKEWNERMNLTNITDDQGIALRHFVDSLTLIPHLEKEMHRKKRKSLSLIDVGTGAGFPGIPLKVAMPALEVTLLDSLRKRVGFLDAVCREIALTGIVTLHGRAEDVGKNKMHREAFDVATARAVASLPILCEYCMPFVKVGGIFLAMKGYAEDEVKAAQKAVVTLGGTIEDHFDFYLPGTDMKRSIIQIRKLRPTPPKYPRQAGKPEKEPIL